MPALTAADSIRILVATDNHVGYNERDPIRGNDSLTSFHEVMCLAKERDVDMVLLAGDLFHENKPSRKSMFHVMQSLRMNCYGEKPCELEMLSDSSEAFHGAFNHVNYEDPDINVAIPVFSIHGNHDDPSGEGHLAALDLLSISGLINYYGRTPESDNILVKPVLFQKGRTKLALYGMSNVRDERLFRTFRDGKVKFFQPSTQKDNWFNLMSVHQNSHAYTEKGYLPENFLPDFLDLVVWGHEHECLIEPRFNAEMNFHIMQPGSSVATSLMPGEAVVKHVAILSITGKEFKSESIRLKTVRPFVMKEIILQEEPGMKALAMKESNRTDITRHLVSIVEEMIKEARAEWVAAQEDEQVDEKTIPLPLVRLRVEFSAPEGGKFDCENPQRFSNRFIEKVANTNDVIQFHRRKTAAKKLRDQPDMPEDSVLAEITLDSVKVERLVREFLTAQSLTILPQNSFGDAVSQFVDKDDKHAMELFVQESLKNQVKHLLDVGDADEDLAQIMEDNRSKLEELFAAGHLKSHQKRKLKPKPPEWDSDLDGHWADEPGAVAIDEENGGNENDEEEDADLVAPRTSATRGRGKATTAGRGGKAATTASRATTAKATTAQRSRAATDKSNTTRTRAGRRRQRPDDEDDEDDIIADEDDDVVMLTEEEEDTRPPPSCTTARAPVRVTRATNPSASKAPTRAKTTTKAAGRQTQLAFAQPPSQSTQPPAKISALKTTQRFHQEISDDEISDDDDDAFAPAPPAIRSRGRR